MHHLLIVGTLSACALLPVMATAAEDAIATDRPDFVESSDVVGKGRLQIETSVAVERDSRDGVRSRLYSTPTLLRMGVSETVELRLETDGLLDQRVDEAGVRTSERGVADLSIGAKWHVQEGDEEGLRPGIAWLLHVDADSGSRAFRGQGWRPSLRLVAEWEFAGGYSAGVMPGLFIERNDLGERYVGGILAAVAGKSFTDQTRGFVELSGQQLASSKNGGNVVTFDLGLAYLVSRSMQVDTAVSWGLNKNTPDISWIAGFSVRF
jgi:hypothetical protein